MIAALVQTRDRLGEYSGSRTACALSRAPTSCRRWPARWRIAEAPGERVLLGASLGAVASLSTAFRYPGVFGGLVLKSGSFILDERKLARRPHPVFHRIARVMRALRRAPPLPPTRAFVSTGELEGLASENRALASFLRERGVDVLFKSAWDGHHWHNWRDQLRDGLRWVLRPGRQTGRPRLTGALSPVPATRGERGMAAAHRQYRPVARRRHLLADRLREPARRARCST